MVSESEALKMTAEQAAKLPAAELAEVLKAWVKAGKAELPAALAAAGDKAVKAAAKKALYQLKSSGVAVPEAAPAKSAAVATVAAAEEPKGSDEVSSGILSHVLGTGERALFFARPRSGGGLDLYQCIIHDELGVLQFDKAESNRSAFRKRLKEVRANNEPVLIVDQARVKLELGRAWHQNVESHGPLPEGAVVALRRLEVVPVAAQEALPAAEPGDEALATRAAQLFEQDEIAQWLPPEASIKLLAQRVEEVNASPLALSGPQKQQQLDAKIELTASEFLTPATRALYGHRLWKTAEIFAATGRDEAAQLARATARALASGKGPSAFVHRFFGRVVELSAQAKAEQQAVQQAPPPRATPGRLIVP